MDLNALMVGIEAKIDGAAPVTAIIGTRRYFAEAPPDTAFPYIVYFIISDVPVRTFVDDDMEDMRIQFSMFSNIKPTNPAEPNALDLAVKNAFDRQTITVAGYTNISFLHAGGQAIKEDKAWHYWQDYLVQLDD